ncbi:MAG: serine/threonine-protein kinase [Planctomycetota bacterium]|jgi:predicted ATPase
MEGTALGPYRIELELGSGGMGKVYRAAVEGRAPGLERGTRVALKVIHPHLLETEGFFKRFLREAEIGKAVRHPNVVRCYDADALTVENAHHNFLVMEYVEGQTLRDLLDELETVPEELSRHIGREVSKGLAAIHEAGVVHRDLKPENVLITPDHVVKIMDLGVARLADEAIRLSQTGAFVGSPHYAAPEQFRGGGEDLDGRADLHALGLILYELSSGQHPYLADDIPQVLRKVLEEEPRRLGALNPQLSPFFEEVVHTLLAKDREKRFDSALKLLAVLEQGEESAWWGRRARTLRAETKRPLRRIRIPRETAVYGREEDLGKLRALYERVKGGDGQVVLIEGEAGIGKTRLVDELIGRLQREAEEINFLFSSYPPGGAATAAGAWSTAYREQFGAEGLTETLERYLTVTPVLIPAFAALLRGEPPPEGKEPLTKDSIQTVFVHATRVLAEEHPTVVLIEDLHFAPEEGRALFASLALAVPDHRILLVGTARPGIPEDWRANLERLDQASRMDLQRLGAKDLAQLLVDAFRSERLAHELGVRIAEKSDGNPFFVFEIIRGLREGRFITMRPDGTWVTTRLIRDIEIPASVQDLIQARIADLDEEEQEILDVAACCGFEFDPTLVAEVLDLRPVPALRRLSHLEKSHRLVRSAGRDYAFDHHQVQEVLYGGLNDRLREQYHAAIGGTLAARHPEPEGAKAVDLCLHLLKGARGEEALRHLDAALDHLETGYLHDQAIALANLALGSEGLLTSARRAKALLDHAERLQFLGRPEPRRGIRAHRVLGDLLHGQARHQEAERELQQSLDLSLQVGDRRGEGEALGSLGAVLWALGRYDEAREKTDRHLAIAREIGDRKGEGHAIGDLGVAHWSVGRYEEAREHFERSLAIAREIGDRASELRATGNLGLVLSLGRTEEARDRYERALAISREIGLRRSEGISRANLGAVFHGLGCYVETRDHHERALAIAREVGDAILEAHVRVNLGLLFQALGQGTEERAHLERALEIARETGNRQGEGFALQALAAAAEATGDTEGQRRLCEEALAVRRTAEDRAGIAMSLKLLGRILLAEGRHEEALGHLTEALALGREIRAAGQIVLAEALLALLPGGDPAAALQAYEEHEPHLRLLEKMEARFYLWRATDDSGYLEEAHRLLCHLRDHAPEECRESMIENVPLNRDIMAAWAEHGVP